MSELVLTLLLTCLPTIITNESKEAWESYDQTIYQNNLNSCERKFGPEFKCLKSFTKREYRVYWAICSPPVK